LVVAGLKALGYFTESHLVLRDEGKEVLELDVVATPVGEPPKSKSVFEAKKATVSFPDVFKLFGQRMYLGIDRAYLVHLEPLDAAVAAVYDKHAARMGVTVCHCPPDLPALERLAPAKNALTVEQRARVAAAAWYQHIARRLALAAFNYECKQQKRLSTIHEELRQYVLRVREAFFQPTALARAEALYEAYFHNPKLTGQMVAKLAKESGATDIGIWNRVNDNHDLLWLQYVMLVESTARVGIIKNALDDVVERGGVPPPTQDVQIRTSKGVIQAKWPLHMCLPPRFIVGLEKVQSHPHGLRVAYLFQVFLEVFGGILAPGDEAELRLLSDLTGIPQADIIATLNLYDQFFDADGTSYFYMQKGELLCMKMVPGFVRGGGAFLRSIVLGVDRYEARYPNMGWLLGLLHDRLYRLLESVLRKS
jgi:hypothetical protein